MVASCAASRDDWEFLLCGWSGARLLAGVCGWSRGRLLDGVAALSWVAAFSGCLLSCCGS